VASEPSRIHATFRFGEEFELDLRAYQLRHSGRVVRLERIPMDLLILLVDRAGELVTREQIVEKVWGKDVFLDTDNSINGAVRKLRRALQDDPDQPRLIETVPARGYRFIAPLNGADPVAAATSSLPQPVVAEAMDEPVHIRPHLSIRVAFMGVALVLVAALGSWILWSRSATRRALPEGKLTLAVLPFENLTGDPAQEYFSDGLTEEMISRLGSLDPERLGVIARTSVTRYKQSQDPLPSLARDLGVQYVLEGSVRRGAGRVRIAAQLIQVSDQTHLWARQYDRDMNSLLAVQEEIAQAVAREIQISLGDTRGARAPAALSPESLEAYDLYLQGRFFWNKRTADGFRQAIQHFQRAADKDPGYARAYAGLADSYALMSAYDSGPPTELIPKARSAALRALELDDRLAEAHTSLALIHENYDWDWRAAEDEFRRAIQLDPNYATAHHWYAEFLASQGRFDEALAESDRALRLDPLSLIIATDRGVIFYYARQYDRAIEQFRSVLAIDPTVGRAHIIIAAYLQKGMFKEALAEADRWHSLDDSPWSWLAYVQVYGTSGRLAEARKALEKFKQANRSGTLGQTSVMGAAYFWMGDDDKALAYLQQAYREHLNITTLKVEPSLDRIRNDPRFQDLLRRMDLDH
jgi:TolB-like protein/DNA-binding winged helix-turn-helix (wHTH) protein